MNEIAFQTFILFLVSTTSGLRVHFEPLGLFSGLIILSSKLAEILFVSLQLFFVLALTVMLALSRDRTTAVRLAIFRESLGR